MPQMMLYQRAASQRAGGLGCGVVFLFLVAMALLVSLNWETLHGWVTHILQSTR
jgi:hypothetical protein